MKLLPAAGQVREKTHANADASLRDVGLRLAAPGGTGNVEMNPWAVTDELRQKRRSGDGAAGPSARVLHVGDRTS